MTDLVSLFCSLIFSLLLSSPPLPAGLSGFPVSLQVGILKACIWKLTSWHTLAFLSLALSFALFAGQRYWFPGQQRFSEAQKRGQQQGANTHACTHTLRHLYIAHTHSLVHFYQEHNQSCPETDPC